MLGMMGAVSSFQFGRQVASWMNARKNPESKDSVDEKRPETPMTSASQTITTASQNISSRSELERRKPRIVFRPMYSIFLVVGALMSLYIVGDAVHGIQFYKNMTMMALIAPFGALIRWKMAMWNSPRYRCPSCLQWLPWGTLSANLTGATISIVCTSILDRYGSHPSVDHPWTEAAFFAVTVGFAGSLSTVSSMVKEIVLLSEQYPGHAKPHFYGLVTILGGMLVGLVFYTAIVRPS
jgi:fluoride ion exporter CrcB/FEX